MSHYYNLLLFSHKRHISWHTKVMKWIRPTTNIVYGPDPTRVERLASNNPTRRLVGEAVPKVYEPIYPASTLPAACWFHGTRLHGIQSSRCCSAAKSRTGAGRAGKHTCSGGILPVVEPYNRDGTRDRLASRTLVAGTVLVAEEKDYIYELYQHCDSKSRRLYGRNQLPGTRAHKYVEASTINTPLLPLPPKQLREASQRHQSKQSSKARKPGKQSPAEEEVDVKNLIVEVRATSQVWKLCRLDSTLIIQNSISDSSLLLAFHLQNNKNQFCLKHPIPICYFFRALDYKVKPKNINHIFSYFNGNEIHTYG